MAPGAGAVSATEGGRSTLSTVTPTAAEAVVWAALSVAVAVSVRAPSATPVLSQDTDQPSPPLVSVPILAPSTKNWTWVTPLSSLAFAVTAMVPATVAPGAGAVSATEGGASPTPAMGGRERSTAKVPAPEKE